MSTCPTEPSAWDPVSGVPARHGGAGPGPSAVLRARAERQASYDALVADLRVADDLLTA